MEGSADTVSGQNHPQGRVFYFPAIQQLMADTGEITVQLCGEIQSGLEGLRVRKSLDLV